MKKTVFVFGWVLIFCMIGFFTPVFATDKEEEALVQADAINGVAFKKIDMTTHEQVPIIIPVTGIMEERTAREVPGMSAIGTRSIIGGDSRVMLDRTAMNFMPYSAIGLVEMYYDNLYGDGITYQSSGTGWLFGKNHVMTAGHTLYDFEFDKFPDRIVFTPAYNGDYPHYSACQVTTTYIPEEYVSKCRNKELKEAENWDYGIMELDRNIGEISGYMGYRTQQTSYEDEAAFVAGYPYDKELSVGGKKVLYRGVGTITSDNGKKLNYKCDTTEGQSGGPIFTTWWGSEWGSEWPALGIHSHGRQPGSETNGGVKITSNIFDVMQTFRGE